MPLKLNIGLSRKVGEPNFGSRGASINLEMELESAVVTEPAKLQDRIRKMFNLVRTSLTEELNGGSVEHSKEGTSVPPPRATVPIETADRRSAEPRLATPAQVKALFAISRQRGIDLKALIQQRFGVFRTADLTLSEASKLIDELKSGQVGEYRQSA